MRTFQKSVVSLISVLICIMLFTGCGRKGSPRPPEEIAPAAVRFFTVTGLVDGIKLQWQAPNTTAKGGELLDLEGFIIRKNKVVANKSPEFQEIARIPLDQGKIISSQDNKEAVLYEFLDQKVVAGKRYDYYILPFNTSNVEGASTEVIRITFIGESSIIIQKRR